MARHNVVFCNSQQAADLLEISREELWALVEQGVVRVHVRKGKKVFRKCRACHKLDEGKHGVGPSLHGIINRDIANVDGYDKFSDVLKGLPGNWTATELAKFLADPKGYAKGTKMRFNGLKKEKEIVDLIHFLNESDGTPDPLK